MRRGKHRAHEGDRETIDHVFPTSSGVPDGKPFLWRLRNQVKACRGCNELKRSMPPLLWLARMPEYGVAALGKLLVDLGIAQTDVDRWLEIRRQRELAGKEML